MTLPSRLLLVEDDDAVREVLREGLEHAGFAVDTAQTTTEALKNLAARRYGAIATDCVLPDLAPLDWLAAVRGAAPDTPLVLYSGTVAHDELHRLARDWGATAVLEKPFKLAELVEAVRAALAGRQGGLRTQSGGVEPWRLIVVQRTQRAVLQGILQNPDRWPARSAVMPDHRQRERRLRLQQVTIERRRSQRRAEPDAMWYTHGFIVIETAALPTVAIRLTTRA